MQDSCSRSRVVGKLTRTDYPVERYQRQFLLMRITVGQTSCEKRHFILRFWILTIPQHFCWWVGDKYTALFSANSPLSAPTLNSIQNILHMIQPIYYMSFDQILESRIGFGPSQIYPFLFLCLIDMNDGTQLVLSSFLTPVITEEWTLPSSTVSLLSSIFYFGIFIGSILSGKLADQYGRKPLIIIGSLMQLSVSVFFYFVSTVWQMLIARLLYGLSFGFTIAITCSMYAESAPLAYRGKGLLLLNFAISLGKVYGVLLASVFLLDFSHGNWRAMMVLSALPNLLVLYGALFVIRQSPRYLLAHRQYPQAYAVIDQLLLNNNHSPPLTDPQKHSLTIDNPQYKSSSLLQLFTPAHLRSTAALSACWFFINFIYYGQLIILPFILSKESKSFWSYTLTILGEAPCLLLSLYLIDRPAWGRKHSMLCFFVGSAVCHLLFAAHSAALISSLARFFMKEVYQMLYPCTTECFPTPVRTMAFGLCSAVGRLGAVAMPYAIFPLLHSADRAIFLLFALGAAIGAGCTYLLPKDTCGRKLDQQVQLIQK